MIVPCLAKFSRRLLSSKGEITNAKGQLAKVCALETTFLCKCVRLKVVQRGSAQVACINGELLLAGEDVIVMHGEQPVGKDGTSRPGIESRQAFIEGVGVASLQIVDQE